MRNRNQGPALHSIRGRMVLGYLLITFIGFAIVLVSVSGIVENYLVHQRVSEQTRSVEEIATAVESYVREGEAAQLYNMAVSYSQELSGRVLIVDKNGVVQIDALSALNGRAPDYSEINRVLFYGASSDYGFHRMVESGDGFFQSLFPKEEWTVYYVSAIGGPGEGLGAVVFSASIQDVKDSVASIRAQLLLIIAVVAVGIIVVASLTAKSITRPITELTRIIRRMSRGEWNLRAKVEGKTEVDELGRSFNDMSERLEHTERFRSEFVSNASHEIKTPLASMKILIESLLCQDQLDECVTREFLGDVNKEIDRLSTVVSDLLEMVRLDQNEDTFRPARTDLSELCEVAVKRIRPIAEQKGIRLQTALPSLFAEVDPVKMEQVIFNLIDNAVKYTDGSGTVTVSLALDGDTAVIGVKDEGIGIPEKDIPHIFERFYRVDKARSRDTGGTGLGLSIVERIVRQHGGSIEVHSRENQGTAFYVRLPLVQGERENREAI